uniref:Uncharacterized protein n=1 Tax=Arundo donax TaxID=35708 RepID=A0A0A9BU34_ARUDO
MCFPILHVYDAYYVSMPTLSNRIGTDAVCASCYPLPFLTLGLCSF